MSLLTEIMAGKFSPEARDLLTDTGKPVAALRRYAAGRGHSARPGGWLYFADGATITQGWHNYASMMLRAGSLRQDEECCKAAQENRVRRMRRAADRRRELAGEHSEADRTTSRVRERWEREAREYDAEADRIEALPV
jgi:hypothetical protein